MTIRAKLKTSPPALLPKPILLRLEFDKRKRCPPRIVDMNVREVAGVVAVEFEWDAEVNNGKKYLWICLESVPVETSAIEEAKRRLKAA